jgi:hypothetical protein
MNWDAGGGEPRGLKMGARWNAGGVRAGSPAGIMGAESETDVTAGAASIAWCAQGATAPLGEEW